jgi:hypothetical protein
MRLRYVGVAASLLLLGACGSNDETFTISSGAYAVSGATATQTGDACGLLAIYSDTSKEIDLTVNGSTVTFNLSQDASAPSNALPTATISGNTLSKLAEASYTALGRNDTGCLLRLRTSVSGEITANDDTALTLSVDISEDAASPTPCTASDISDDATSATCQSGFHFLAKKVTTSS